MEENNYKKKYLSLAYRFPMAYYNDLLQMAESYVDLKADCRWEVRLYSQDSRLKPDWQVGGSPFLPNWCLWNVQFDQLRLELLAASQAVLQS